jgi:hypothetical protein
MRFVVALILASASHLANACSCPGFLDNDVAGSATTVFVFNLVDARMLDPEADLQRVYSGDEHPDANRVSARIRVVDTLRGDSSRFGSTEFWVHYCCGIRLGFGEYFVAFADGDGPVFEATNANVLSIGPFYDAGSETGIRRDLHELLSGGKPLDPRVFDYSWERLGMVGRPPPPTCVPTAEPPQE